MENNENEINNKKPALSFKVVVNGFVNFFKKPQTIKMLIALAIAIGFSIGVWFVLNSLGLVGEGSQASMEERLAGGTIIGVAAIFVSMYVVAAVFLSFIPGTTTVFTILGFTIFPTVWIGIFVVIIAKLITAIILYMIGWFGGSKLMYWIFGKEKVEKRLAKISLYGTKVIPWLFLVPFMPNDLLCMFCGTIKMKPLHFILIVVIFRPIESVVIWLQYQFIDGVFLDFWNYMGFGRALFYCADGYLIEYYYNLFSTQILMNQIFFVTGVVLVFIALIQYHKLLIKIFKKTILGKEYKKVKADYMIEVESRESA
ncbi:MAG: VTT domain-containing protein [Erysipelotrichales bacterium]|nr:VTT domain-containing protein [Erysipelotrichales bacterium]